MKMPEKHDLLYAILAAKELSIQGNLAFTMAYLHDDTMAVRFTKTVIDATMYIIA